VAKSSLMFSFSGISFALGRRVLSFAKNIVDMGDASAVLLYQCADTIYKVMFGDWPEDIDFDFGLVDSNLANGDFYWTTVYMLWACIFHTERGDFDAAQQAAQKIAGIGETFDNKFAIVVASTVKTIVLTKYRRMQEALKVVEEGILFTRKTGLKPWLIILNSLKARTQTMLGDMSGASDSIGHTKRIRAEVIAAPPFIWESDLMELILNLHRLDESMKTGDKYASSIHRRNALKSGTAACKTASKLAPIRTETLKMMGVYYWLINKQRKAFKWWRKAIHEGTRLNERLELSRTYFEVGKRLLEPKSKNKELDGIKAEEYLEKARVMFEEMDLQWDLDELEKLRLHMGT
jgi:hypothetical protein